MLTYFILLILCLISLHFIKYMFILDEAYHKVLIAHQELFKSLNEREDYLINTYKDDLDLINYYTKLKENPNLKERIDEEINLDSIDDEFDLLTSNIITNLKTYNKEVKLFKPYKNKYRLLYKIANYIEYNEY